MRCPICHNEIVEAGSCPGCIIQPPARRQDMEQEQERELRQQAKRSQKPERKNVAKRASRGATGVATLLVIAVALVAGGLGCYYVVFSYYDSKQVEPKSALNLMERFRRLPSNQADMTVDQFLDKEFQAYKRRGTLLRYEGWKVNLIKGTETRFLIVYSFEDSSNIEHRAEWVADVEKNSFTPQTELASAAYKR